MDRNRQIKKNLEKEYLKYEKYFAKTDAIKGVKQYCKEWDLSINELIKMDSSDLSDEEYCVLQVLDNTDLQKEIQSSIDVVKTINCPTNQDLLYASVKQAFKEAALKQKETNVATQIIFLEHDFDPYACLCGFGAGNYPVLDTPEYIKYDFTQEAFNGVGKIDYSPIWRFAQTKWFEEYFGVPIDFFTNIHRFYTALTYLMLHDVMKKLANDEVLKELNKIEPLFIYANEHDCEASNIFIFE